MPWVRVDDHFDEHPKFGQVGPLGVALWVTGLAYCNRNLTDGFIPWAIAHKMLTWEFLGPEPYVAGKGFHKYTIAVTSGVQGDDVTNEFVIELLVAAGLWEPVERGYQVHDYADYQPTRDKVEDERRKKQAAGQAGGQASATARAQANGVAPAVADAQAKSNPVPGPVPGTRSRSQTEAGEDAPSLRSGGAADASPPTTKRGNPRVAAVINAFRDLELTVHLTPRDHAAIKKSEAPPELIAETYAAVARAQWGDDFMRKRLSVHDAIEWTNAYAAQRDPPPDLGDCLCAELKDRLTRYPTANAYCEVHGDVRELA